MLVGQKKLKAWLDSYTAATLPKTIMFIGEKGCGKHWFAADIAKRFNWKLVEINENISHDQLVEYSQTVTPTLYVIDLTYFDEKKQNQFLKFIEEPSACVHIVCTTTSEIGVLNTILNRCIKMHFEPYTKEELIKFSWMSDVPEEYAGVICRTPGQVISIDAKSLTSMFELCNKMLTAVRLASYPNLMKLTMKFNYKEEYDKYDFYTFLNVLEYVSFSDYVKTNSQDSRIIYFKTNEAKQNRYGKTLALESLATNFFNTLWEALHQ